MNSPRAEQCDIENPYLAHSSRRKRMRDSCIIAKVRFENTIKADYV